MARDLSKELDHIVLMTSVFERFIERLEGIDTRLTALEGGCIPEGSVEPGVDRAHLGATPQPDDSIRMGS